MGFYSNDNLYVPQTFEELEQQFFNKYIQDFPDILSVDNMRQSNIYLKVIKPILLYATQTDITLGSLYDQLIQYIKNSQEEVLVFGSSLEGLTNALNNLSFVEVANLSDSNVDGALSAGQVQIAIKYENNEANNNEIAKTLLNNAGAGIEFLGDIEVTSATSITGQSFIFRWTEFIEKKLEVALTVTYDAGFAGVPLTLEEVEEFWYDRFVENYKAGQDIVPYFYNSGIPSLSSCSSVFTIDSVAQPADTTVVGVYNELYNLDRADVVATEAP